MDFSTTCPDGYYVSSASYTSSYVYTLVSNGMKMNAGDIEFFEDDYAYYVIAKYDLIEKAYKTDEQLQYIDKYAAESYFNKLLEETSKDVVRDEDFISKVRLINIGDSVDRNRFYSFIEALVIQEECRWRFFIYSKDFKLIPSKIIFCLCHSDNRKGCADV
jgi:hypothetical protein